MHKKKGKSSFMIVKVDLAKEIVFTDHFCKLILSCVSSTSIELCKVTQFHHTCFFIEGLAHLIEREVAYNNWKPSKLCRVEPSISHLFFLMSSYCLERPINVHNSRTMKLSCISGFHLTSNLGKYLGVLMLHDRKKNETYAYLLEKTQHPLSNWRANSLSFAGRCTLAKVVVATLPTYTMCWKYYRYMIRYDREIKFSSRCGMYEFRNLHMFNHALIMKLGKGLITNPNVLWVLRRIDHESKVWRGILSTWKSLLLGGRW
ncbi:putative ribonuclease H protein, partial [Mucuna pruriens]